jgi:regulator of cell morphogenesis and NO signaling
MTTTLNLTDSVGDWVTRFPSTSRVFEQHGIDYCCGGGRSLEEACWAERADAQSVLAELAAAVSQNPDESEADFASKSLTEMCDAIEATHHKYLKAELPRLAELVKKVVSVHGDQHEWLHRVAGSFQQLQGELVPHMFKEEQVLFPAIRMIERTQSVPAFPFGSVGNPIRMMEHEHDEAGRALKEIRTATSDFTLPDGGCNTFRAMLDGLRELEADLHRHIHKENNVLFPRALQLASELGQASISGSCP